MQIYVSRLLRVKWTGSYVYVHFLWESICRTGSWPQLYRLAHGQGYTVPWVTFATLAVNLPIIWTLLPYPSSVPFYLIYHLYKCIHVSRQLRGLCMGQCHFLCSIRFYFFPRKNMDKYVNYYAPLLSFCCCFFVIFFFRKKNQLMPLCRYCRKNYLFDIFLLVLLFIGSLQIFINHWTMIFSNIILTLLVSHSISTN